MTRMVRIGDRLPQRPCGFCPEGSRRSAFTKTIFRLITNSESLREQVDTNGFAGVIR